MNKKNRDNFTWIISVIFLIGSLYLFWQFNMYNIILFFAIILVTPIIRFILINVIPIKKKKTRKKVSNKSNTSSKVQPSSTRKINRNRLRSDDEIIKDTLENLSWREFERLCFLYFKAKGFKPKETSEGADAGVDLILYNPKDKGLEAVQIKHYIHSGNQITVKEIRELASAKKNHKCMVSKFITTSTFTQPALKEADSFKIDCHNIDWVNNKIVKWKESQSRIIST